LSGKNDSGLGLEKSRQQTQGTAWKVKKKYENQETQEREPSGPNTEERKKKKALLIELEVLDSERSQKNESKAGGNPVKGWEIHLTAQQKSSKSPFKIGRGSCAWGVPGQDAVPRQNGSLKEER